MSVNASISKEYAPTEVISLRAAIDQVSKSGPGTLMTVIDISSAFRHIPVHPDDVPLLGFRDINGKTHFSITLPFGLRSSPGLFDRLARAIEHIAAKRGFKDLLR